MPGAQFEPVDTRQFWIQSAHWWQTFVSLLQAMKPELVVALEEDDVPELPPPQPTREPAAARAAHTLRRSAKNRGCKKAIGGPQERQSWLLSL
jgi:hypothetical protein